MIRPMLRRLLPAMRASGTAVEDLLERLEALQRRVAEMDDQAAIGALLTRYARGIDRHDVALLESVFWPDAQIGYGEYASGRDAFIEWGNANHERIAAQHQHHITNKTIDLDGDVAHVESYVLYFLRAKDDGQTTVGGGRYIDKMERRNGEWRISLREFIPDIRIEANSVFSKSFSAGGLGAPLLGRWDKSDLSYVRPLPRRKNGLKMPQAEAASD